MARFTIVFVVAVASEPLYLNGEQGSKLRERKTCRERYRERQTKRERSAVDLRCPVIVFVYLIANKSALRVPSSLHNFSDVAFTNVQSFFSITLM